MAIQKFLGYAPDLDPTTPGVVTDCDMLEPSIRGLRGAPSAVSTEYTALAGECRGSALVKKLDGTKRLLAGTQTRIYEASGGSWVDRSETTVTAYAGSSESRWEFRQFGDVTIAQNGVDEPQESTASAFATVSTIPIAKLIETASGFLVCANVVDASYAFSGTGFGVHGAEKSPHIGLAGLDQHGPYCPAGGRRLQQLGYSVAMAARPAL